jgi:predicted Zn-dependent protease
LALFAATVAWSAIKADVGSTVALWATSGQREVSDKVLSEAIKAMPHERQYQRQRTFAFLGFAMEDIKRFGASAETFPQIKHSLDIAEKQARGSMLQFPKDPWIVLALANALQIRALPIIRPLAVAEGSHAALEADEMFARAYELFPNQPLLLRNWAQLRFYGGDHWGAYRLLDRMESVIPNEVDPYYERIMLARQIGDSSAVRETLARAGTNLDQLNMTRLTAVANLQQP